MVIKINSILAFLSSIIVLLFFGMPVFAGLGISPSDWIEPNSLVGQQMEKTFVLSRSNPDTDLYFTSQITGEITPWIKIDNGDSFVMPKGTQEFPVKIIVSIPANAQHKNYQGEIRLKSETKEAESTGASSVGVLLSALIRIDLTVSDKGFLDYDVLQISIPQQEQHKPLDVILKIWNKGNTFAKPTKLTMDIFDKFNTIKIDSKTITDFSAIAGVTPFSEGQLVVQIPIQLTPEQYWAHIDVYQDDTVIKTDSITFEIVKAVPQEEPTTATQQKNIWSFITIQNILLVIIIILVLGIAMYFLVKKFRKNKEELVVGESSQNLKEKLSPRKKEPK